MTEFKTKYGIFCAQSKIDPKWINYDKKIAKTHLDNYGVIFVDPDYETPVDDDFILEECNKIYRKTITFKIGERVKLSTGSYGIVVDPSIPTVKLDGSYVYALFSIEQLEKTSSHPVAFSDMSEGSRYLDCSLGLVWKAVKKIPNGMKLQQIKKEGCIINATPISFLLSK